MLTVKYVAFRNKPVDYTGITLPTGSADVKFEAQPADGGSSAGLLLLLLVLLGNAYCPPHTHTPFFC